MKLQMLFGRWCFSDCRPGHSGCNFPLNPRAAVPSPPDKEGYWFFLPLGEPDLKLVPLEELVKADPTLNDVFDLDYGECANRKFIGGQWKREDYEE